MSERLMSRDVFRRSVFERDSYNCVFCGNPAKDAHHILDRRLWLDGGYYLNNGVSVCEKCHIECEATRISVEDILEKLGIKRLTPPHLYPDHQYDKWGNPVLSDGKRMKGELYFDESVQRILDNRIVFTDYVKYPRTYHLPWSKTITKDDRILDDLSSFAGKEIVVSTKMDGENSSVYKNYFHARSIDGQSHPSRGWVKNFVSQFQHDIPDGWRVCGENLYAQHSIRYDELDSYFYGFSIWDEKNVCLSWDDTKEWFELFGIVSVPVMYRGEFNKDILIGIAEKMDLDRNEGYVVRVSDSFAYKDFRKSVAKFVREDHVHTHCHWMHRSIEVNGLKRE